MGLIKGIINYSDLGLKRRPDYVYFNHDGQEYSVCQTLSIEDKYDLIEVTLQKALEGSLYNLTKLAMYFELNCIYLYSNIIFTEEDRQDEGELYDILKQNGLAGEIMKRIPEKDIEALDAILNLEVEKREKKNLSVSGIVQSVIQDLPKNAEEVKNIMEYFDPQKFTEVMNFAKAINGGRDISDFDDYDSLDYIIE